MSSTDDKPNGKELGESYAFMALDQMDDDLTGEDAADYFDDIRGSALDYLEEISRGSVDQAERQALLDHFEVTLRDHQ